MNYEVAIIGAGPAGMSAALYLARFNIHCCLFENGVPGGQMNLTASVENYPGISSIQGPSLAFEMWKQVTSLPVDIYSLEVTDIQKENNGFKVITSSKIITSRFVIIATGRRARKLNVPLEKELTGRGVSYCAVCDGPLYKDKKVAVIGGSMAALEEALYLANICKDVYLVHRREEFRATKSLVEKVKACTNIHFKTPFVVQRFEEQDKKLKALSLLNTKSAEQEILPLDGAFIFIGQEPNTQFVKNLKVLNKNGYFSVNKHYETRLKGMYAVGDVVFKEVSQIILASSEGVTAALDIISKITMEVPHA